LLIKNILNNIYMGLSDNFVAYIRFFTFLSPIIIPSFALLTSLYNQDIKGFLYVLGVTITMLCGRLLSKFIPNYVPHAPPKIPGAIIDTDGKPIGKNWFPYYDPACNLFGSDDSSGWGTFKSSPGPHALFLAFTLFYMILPMFINNNINFMVLGALMLLLILSAVMRVAPPLNCVKWIDIVMGWGTGFILGTLWFFLIRWVNTTYTSNSLTYFNKLKSDKQMCVLEKSAFRCKKSKNAT